MTRLAQFRDEIALHIGEAMEITGKGFFVRGIIGSVAPLAGETLEIRFRTLERDMNYPFRGEARGISNFVPLNTAHHSYTVHVRATCMERDSDGALVLVNALLGERAKFVGAATKTA